LSRRSEFGRRTNRAGPHQLPVAVLSTGRVRENPMRRIGARFAFSLAVTLTSWAGAALAPAAHAAPNWVSGCIAPPVLAGDETYRYKQGCSGHDEPELDPLSGLPGSAKNLTWTVVLPSDGRFEVASTGPT